MIELIDKVAHNTFGTSFKNDFPKDYTNIDHLFRCRNKIAHRGELSFTKDGGHKVIADNTMAKEWYYSIIELIKWANSLDYKPPS